ncbi:DUF6497 family protein [Ascidiaceihabitans sp.]|uniref:DUF6497 family protein n=2 Tax=Ascidiaceihabitans sp. TaxID=1872644 RepID=UPI0032978714
MMLRIVTLVMGLAGSAAVAQDVPSGQSVTLFDALIDKVEGQTWLRMRYVAPAIARDGGGVDYDTASIDMAHLCASAALPYANEYAIDPHTVVISLSDRETEFGVQDQEATQFFEAYRVQNDACIWEAF